MPFSAAVRQLWAAISITVPGAIIRPSRLTPAGTGTAQKHLGAQIGFLAILHSWGQNLLLHPHIHCLVPVGGLSPDRSHWVQPRYRFFLPLGVLKKVCRGKFLDGLKRAYRRNKLSLGGATGPLKDPKASGLFFNLCTRKTGSSMSSKRWQVQRRCFAIWAAIPIALPSAITDWSPLMGNKSLSAERTMHAATHSAS